ncbi:MAG: APC family permease [Candidatus Scalindua sp.]|nr:APC family permease [Candidatus Scalindua sp.]
MNSHDTQQFSRSLNRYDIVCIGINGTVGAGIFLLPGKIAALTGPASVLIYLFCGLLCLAIALCFAEMGGMYQQTGGAYLYARDTFGPMTGFMVGWMIWISAIVGWATMASGFLLYLGYFSPELSEGWSGKIIITALITSLSTLNFLGVKIGARVINFFTISKLIPLCIFILWGVSHVEVSSLHPIVVFDGNTIGSAVVLALFAFTGFEHLAVPAGEMRNPRKDIPKAFFLVIAGSTIVYISVQAIAVGTFPQLADSEKPLADAATSFLGPRGGVLIAAGALLAIAGINSGIALTGPRNLYALSKDGFLPKLFSKIHPQFHTPYLAIIVCSSLTLMLTLTGTFEYLVFASVLVSLLQYIPTCLAVIILRKRRPELSRSYKIPGGYIIPCLALVTCLWLLMQVKMGVILATLGCMMLSLPFYFLRKRDSL